MLYFARIIFHGKDHNMGNLRNVILLKTNPLKVVMLISTEGNMSIMVK